MESTRQKEKNNPTTTAQAVEVSKEINAGSENFLTPAKLEKIETDDLDLDRPATVKTLSQVAKQTVLTNEKSVMDILTAAEQAGEGNAQEIRDAIYWQPEEGEILNVIVTGLRVTTIDKKDVKVVCFKDKKSVEYIAGATTLVKAIEKIENELPAVIRIVVKGKVNGENGKYFTFDIFRL